MRPYQYVLIIFVLSLAAMIAANGPWWVYVLAILALLHILAIGAIFIRLNLFIPALHKGTNTKYVALTFDDGPADHTGEVLDALAAEGVKAAFFTIGKRAVANPEMVKRWHNEGHIIGNHSYNHGFWFDMLPASKMEEELTATNETVRTIIGLTPSMFRPPYGVTNPALAKAVKRSGMFTIGWSIRSFDTKAKSSEALIERIVSRLKGGDVILLHDSLPITASSLTTLIKAIRAKGFTFVRPDELLNIKPYA